MAPAEAAILAQFLLVPAQLPAILSLEDFAALFPKRLQHDHAASIRTLYRDLQLQRAAAVEDVSSAIDAEIARSRQLRRHVLRAHLQAAAQEDAGADDELQIERFVGDGGTNSSARGEPTNATAVAATAATAAAASLSATTSLPAVVGDLEAAVEDLEADLRRLADEEVRLREELQQSVGSLSDLRYGRLTNPQLRDQVLEGLQAVQEICEAATGSTATTTTTTFT